MNFHSNKAIYIQIADLICEKILAGIFKEEERIPSVRELAVDLEVNPNTVMRTYEYLQDLEIISNKRGVGFFVNTESIKRVTTYLRKEFMEQELPNLFKNMKILAINISEIEKLYLQYLQHNIKNNNEKK
ncbi:MAG: GntR family transcriptional regulator [Chitinophaga sp.]|nr:GntR family transcriptional regulator [Chitinophaga sp.]